MKALHCSPLAIGLAAMWVGCHQNDRTLSKNSGDAPNRSEPSTIAPPSNENQKLTDVPRAIGGGPIDPAVRSDVIAVVRKIAAARCDREARCDNVGATRNFATRTECLTTMASYKHAHINFEKCPLGVAEPKVENCLKAIRAEDCSAARSLERINACRMAALCTQQ
jgi:hypothetical protein